LGSANVITDWNGNRVQRYEYATWGNTTRADCTTTPCAEPTHHFTGQEVDPESGLHYYVGRYYDHETGRFISADPFVQDPDDPQNLNRYSYVLNNPQNYIDPSGYSLEDFDLSPLGGYTPYFGGTSSFGTIELIKFANPSGFGSMQTMGGLSNTFTSFGGLTFGGLAQTALDAGGWLPGLPGTIATLGSAAVSFAQGDYLSGAIGTVAAAGPLVGIPSKVVKTAIEATEIARGFNSLSHAAKFGIQPYNILRTSIREAGFTGLQKHHLIEQRFKRLFMDEKELTKLSIALTPAEHQRFTNAWRKAIEYGEKGTGTADKDLVIQKAREIYENYPDILSRLGL
jgi:RHS repeat-associated protein